MAKQPLTSIVWKEGNYYVAQCLQVDVSSFGETRDEAISSLDEALGLYFEDHSADEIPTIESPEIVTMPLRDA